MSRWACATHRPATSLVGAKHHAPTSRGTHRPPYCARGWAGRDRPAGVGATVELPRPSPCVLGMEPGAWGWAPVGGAGLATLAPIPMPPESRGADGGGGSDAWITWRRFINGAISGTFTAALLQPFDVVRTMQQGVAAAGGGLRGPWATARALVDREGGGALWKGLGPTINRVFWGAGIYFVTLPAVASGLTRAHHVATVGQAGEAGTGHTALPSPRSSSVVSSATPGWVAFASGATARIVAATAMSPVSVVKTRVEYAARGTLPFTSTWSGIGHIARSEGVFALYAGLLPTIIRDAPFSGIYFLAYSRLNQWFDAHGDHPVSVTLSNPVARNFVTGFVAGASATLTTQPADVIRTQLQLVRTDAGDVVGAVARWKALGVVMWRHVTGTVRHQGVSGLFVGATARVVKRGLSTAITWALFEQGMRMGRGSGGSSGG